MQHARLHTDTWRTIMTEEQGRVASIVRDELPMAGRRLLLVPGQTRTSEEVLRASATSFESWSEVERADAECRDGLMPLFGTEQAGIVVVPGAASLGMEVAVVAASPPGAVVLVLGHGPQCDRITHVVSRLSLIHISEPTRLGMISYAVFCLKKKKKKKKLTT